MKKLLPVLLATCSIVSYGQTLYVPSSTSGIGSSANGNVGIGTNAPGAKLEVNGDISIPSSGGNKYIYTWSAGDANWRIGMSPTPGFTTSMATSHVQYVTYSNGTGQGFAAGVNGGQSSFEITGSDHNAFFRGNVGIGTTSPYNPQGWNRVLETSGADHSKILATASNQVYRMGIYSHSTWNGGGGFVGTESNHNLYLTTNSTSKMVIDVNGNVGIGTNSPSQKLEVAGNFRLTGPNGTTHSELQFYRADGGKFASIGQGNLSASNSTFDIQHFNGNDIRFLNGGIEQLRIIASNGNVGIGTTNPGSYKLAVEGKIGAREVNVTTASWPDYVFEKNYKLPSLEEIKTYIDQNQHLPEVPSAKEVEKNGVNLGEMNAVLLKKIEELTLYVIELKKENEEERKTNKAQQNEIEELKKTKGN